MLAGAALLFPALDTQAAPDQGPPYSAPQIANPFGNGVRCVGGGATGIFRFQPMQADASGTASLKVDFAQAPAGAGGPGMWSPGDTWFCQGWYRDPAAGGAAFNLTDGLEVQVCAGHGPYAGMPLVPAGTFVMGQHVGNDDTNATPLHTVGLDAFYMDALEVTARSYVDYLNSALQQGRITVSSGAVFQSGGAGELLCDTLASSVQSYVLWSGTTFDVAINREEHPITKVSWYGACAYANGRSRDHGLTPCYDETNWACDFSADGYRLPTEAEWEHAARAGEHSPYFQFPWGNTIDGSRANYWQSADPFENGPPAFTSPVGYYDGNQVPAGTDMANGYGLYDMAGNVREWCGDWFSPTYDSSSPPDNPTGPVSGTGRVFRGGSWLTYTPFLRSALRLGLQPLERWNSVGFRVVAARR